MGGRREDMDRWPCKYRRRLAAEVEQQGREKRSSRTGRGRSGWYAKRSSGGGKADRDGDGDGDGDARGARGPAHAQQGKPENGRQARLPTGPDWTYLTVRYVRTVGRDQARG